MPKKLVVLMNEQDQDWLCADEDGALWAYPEPHFYEAISHPDSDFIAPGHVISVALWDVRCLKLDDIVKLFDAEPDKEPCDHCGSKACERGDDGTLLGCTDCGYDAPEV